MQCHLLRTQSCVPARMWKHDIHAFFEVSRHWRPESQDYMLAIIYLAYQMMALLFEPVPTFIDTWIECSEDLVPCQMASEDRNDANTAWGWCISSLVQHRFSQVW